MRNPLLLFSVCIQIKTRSYIKTNTTVGGTEYKRKSVVGKTSTGERLLHWLPLSSYVLCTHCINECITGRPVCPAACFRKVAGSIPDEVTGCVRLTMALGSTQK
jgi:hypothetical protein